MRRQMQVVLHLLRRPQGRPHHDTEGRPIRARRVKARTVELEPIRDTITDEQSFVFVLHDAHVTRVTAGLPQLESRVEVPGHAVHKITAVYGVAEPSRGKDAADELPPELAAALKGGEQA